MLQYSSTQGKSLTTFFGMRLWLQFSMVQVTWPAGVRTHWPRLLAADWPQGVSSTRSHLHGGVLRRKKNSKTI